MADISEVLPVSSTSALGVPSRGGMSSAISDAHEDYEDSGLSDNVSFKDWFDMNFKDDYSSLFDSNTSAKSSDSNSSALDQYLEFYNKTGDASWLEKYLDGLIQRENTQSARAYETEMSNTQFSRMIQDIKNAGFNPWIALQSGVGMSSVPSSSAAGYSGTGVYAKNKELAQREAEAGKDLLGRGMSAFALILMALIKAVL